MTVEKRFMYKTTAQNTAGVIVSIIVATSSASANSEASPGTLPLWEAGIIGVNINQLAYPGSDTLVRRNLILPYLVYRGEVFRADRGNVGLRAFKTDTVELDVGVAAALGSSEANVAVRQGMPDLGTLVELGPRLRWQLSDDFLGSQVKADFPLRAVFDVSNAMRYSGVSFEPQLRVNVNQASDWFYSLSVSALFGSERLTDYFYAVPEAYVSAQRTQFDAQAGFIALRSSLLISKRLADNWRGFGFFRYDALSGAKNNASPLRVTNGGWSFGFGLTYIWAESATRVANY
jgi:MipA family protein